MQVTQQTTSINKRQAQKCDLSGHSGPLPVRLPMEMSKYTRGFFPVRCVKCSVPHRTSLDHLEGAKLCLPFVLYWDGKGMFKKRSVHQTESVLCPVEVQKASQKTWKLSSSLELVKLWIRCLLTRYHLISVLWILNATKNQSSSHDFNLLPSRGHLAPCWSSLRWRQAILSPFHPLIAEGHFEIYMS